MDEETTETLKFILGINNSPEEGRVSCLKLAIDEIESIIDSKISNANPSSFDFRNVSSDSVDEIIQDYQKNRDLYLPDLFTVLTLCLIILDLVGHVLFGDEKSVQIEMLLKDDALKIIKSKYKLDDCSIKSISNLRNCLNHNFGLATIIKEKDEDGVYKGKEKFFLSHCDNDNNTNMIIKLGNKAWDGDWSDKSGETSTTVFVFPFIVFVSEVLQTVIDAVKAGKLTTELSKNALQTRFTILKN